MIRGRPEGELWVIYGGHRGQSQPCLRSARPRPPSGDKSSHGSAAGTHLICEVGVRDLSPPVGLKLAPGDQPWSTLALHTLSCSGPVVTQHLGPFEFEGDTWCPLAGSEVAILILGGVVSLRWPLLSLCGTSTSL